MNNDIKNLQNQIDILTKKIASLENSSSIPFNIDKAFEDRKFLKFAGIEEIDPMSYDSLNTLVPATTGDFPVVEFPIRWLRLNLTFGTNGQSFLIPLYTLNNLGL